MNFVANKLCLKKHYAKSKNSDTERYDSTYDCRESKTPRTKISLVVSRIWRQQKGLTIKEYKRILQGGGSLYTVVTQLVSTVKIHRII